MPQCLGQVEDRDRRGGEPANMQQEGMASTESDDFRTMPTASQPMLTLTTVAGELPVLENNGPHKALAQGFKLVGNVTIGANYPNEEFEGIKRKRTVCWKK